MKLQMNELRELGIADGAFERPIAIMQPKVRLQIGRGRESFATVGARKRLLSGMHEYMLLQVC